MGVTVLAVADQVSPVLYDRFDPERWAAVDLILSCGDLPPDYLDFLATNLSAPVLYVRGNHDGGYADERYDGMTNVDGRIVSARGVRVAGFEGCMRYNGGRPQYTQGQMRRRYQRMRWTAKRVGSPDIVVAHAPPAGCHDAQDLCHQGFTCFLDAIDAWRPSFFVHGHVHAYNGATPRSTLGSTTVINAFPYTVFEVPVRAGAPQTALRPIAGRLASSLFAVKHKKEPGL